MEQFSNRTRLRALLLSRTFGLLLLCNSSGQSVMGQDRTGDDTTRVLNNSKPFLAHGSNTKLL